MSKASYGGKNATVDHTLRHVVLRRLSRSKAGVGNNAKVRKGGHRHRMIHCAFIICVILSAKSQATDISLYVFKPMAEKAKVVQEKMQAACSDVNITVFGNSNDFLNRTTADQPSSILSLMPVVESKENYSIISKGAVEGKTEGGYVFVAVDKPFDMASLATSTIGVIDILGRKGTSNYVNQLLNADVKVKRVTKTEDLVTLLTLNLANALLISQEIYLTIKANSELTLETTATDLSVGLATVAASSDSVKSAILSCIKKLPPNINSTLGVEAWTF